MWHLHLFLHFGLNVRLSILVFKFDNALGVIRLPYLFFNFIFTGVFIEYITNEYFLSFSGVYINLQVDF